MPAPHVRRVPLRERHWNALRAALPLPQAILHDVSNRDCGERRVILRGVSDTPRAAARFDRTGRRGASPLLVAARDQFWDKCAQMVALLRDHNLNRRDHKIPRELRLCRFCRDDVEGPVYALFQRVASPSLVAARDRLWDKCPRSVVLLRDRAREKERAL